MKQTIFEKLHEVDPRLTVHVLDLVAKRKRFSGRVEDSSFYRIPSISKMDVTPQEENKLLVGSGLDKKLPAVKEHKLINKQNELNKYMAARIKRMRAVLRMGRPDIFWKIVEQEMKRSTAFRMSAFNAVFNGWYKSQDIQRTYNIMFGVEKIIRENITHLKYFRVEIPKGNPEDIAEFFKNNPGAAWPGKTRPLGVPTAPWRVVLHMWNGFLTIFLEEELKRFNHAYMPGVGTKSALEDFVRTVRHAKHIFEFDIKGFFNNVSISKTCSDLRKRGMPNSTVLHLQDILMSAPENINIRNPDIEKNDYDMQLAWRKFLVRNGDYYEIPGLEVKYAVDQEAHEKRIKNLQDFEMAAFGSIQTVDQPLALKGLPQGAAPSTILSILSLADWHKELESKGIKLLMYADDGILYSDEPFTPFPPKGFEFAEEKSRWVKKEEPVTEEMKFLGVIYNWKSKLLKGATRKGSTLEFNADQNNVFKLLTDILPTGHSMDIMGSLVRSNIFGLALSKLYGGKFGRLQYEEKVEYNNNSYWGKYHSIERLKRDRRLQRVASSIACGWLRHLADHSMGKIDRADMRQASKDFHKNKLWENTDITEGDIKAAYKWESVWDYKDW